MSTVTLNARIKMQSNTKNYWDVEHPNFIPLQGEIINYRDINQVKIGDGVNTVAQLKFLGLDNNNVIPLEYIPKGALENLVIVADAAARLALTADKVQNGDVVKQNDLGVMYYVKNDKLLGTEAAFEEYVTGRASHAPWTGLEGRPGWIDAFPNKIFSEKSFNYSDQSIAYGEGNYAGYKAHKIVSYDKNAGTITLDDSISKFATPLHVQDIININGGNNWGQCGKIDSISDEGIITLDLQYAPFPALPQEITEDLFVFVNGKPDSGPNIMDYGQVSIGADNHAIVRTATAIGRQNIAYGKYSFAGGQKNETGFGAVGLGRNNKVHGMLAFAGGDANKIYGSYTAGFGQQNTANTNAQYSFFAGFYNTLNYKYSIALGEGLINNAYAQMIIGSYNIEDPDAAFIIGNGNSSLRSNLFTIKKDGRVMIRGGAPEGGVLKTEKQLATTEYVDTLIEQKDNELLQLNNSINSKTYGYSGSGAGFSFCIPSTSIPANTVNNQSFTFGQGNTLTGGNGGSFAAGRQLKILKNNNNAASGDSAAFGQNNELAGAPCSGIFGQGNKIHGEGYSFIGGFSNTIDGAGKFAFAYGRGIKLNQQFQIGVGAYNIIDDNARFMVGIGTSDSNRKNAFVVKTDGTATLMAQGTTNDSIARKDYVDTAIEEAKDDIMLSNVIDIIYPINSIYISYSQESPDTLFSGTSWERITNAFLWATDENGIIGETGGEATHILTVEEIPAHEHGVLLTGQGSAINGIPWEYGSANGGLFSGYMGETGGEQAHNNMPPYMNVSVWRRIA